MGGFTELPLYGVLRSSRARLDSPLWWRVYSRLDDGSRGRQAVEDRRSRPDHGPLDQDDPLLRESRAAGAASSDRGRIQALRTGGGRPAPVRPEGEAARPEAGGDGAQDGRTLGVPPEPPLLPDEGLCAVGWRAAH